MGKGGKKRRHGGGRGGSRKRRPAATFPVGKISISARGYGFVDTPEGKFFVPASKTHGAMDGDTVRVRVRRSTRGARRPGGGRGPGGGSRGYSADGAGDPGYASHASPSETASVDRVLERAHEGLVGLYTSLDGIGFVMPQDARLDFLVKAHPKRGLEVRDGDVVYLVMETYPSRRETPSGHIDRVIGHEDDPGILEEIIAARHGIETGFPQEALDEAESLSLDVEGALAEPDRRDIRDRFILTIDPADARDFDDALSIERVGGEIALGVHIADVSSYVSWGGPLDLEARRRATSTYFPDRVVPMLPERLSNGLCSLNPGQDRLAFTVDIRLDPQGTILGYEAYPSAIRSDLRLDYGCVQEMLDGAREYPSDEAKAALEELSRLGKALFKKRMARGSLDFDTVELKAVFDEEGRVSDIVKRGRNDATGLVEEAMILANEVVAGHMLSAGAPMVYRVHDAPSLAAMQDVLPALRELGYAKDGAPVTNSQVQRILRESADAPEREAVSMLLLRSMQQAVYRPSYTTHFGLASPGYAHFTSPIRRYPDLMAHRMLRKQLWDAAVAKGDIARSAPLPAAIAGLRGVEDELVRICEHSSVMEREAQAAAYEALDFKVAQYMGRFVGETFDATIINVLRFGFFVRLSNGCEGLVPLRSLSGWYEFDEPRRALVNSDSVTGESYRLGQRVRVRLTSASERAGKLTFELADM